MLSSISDRLKNQREEEEAKVEEYKRRQREICQLKEEEYRGETKHYDSNGILQPNYYANMAVDDLIIESAVFVRDGKAYFVYTFLTHRVAP